MQLDKYG